MANKTISVTVEVDKLKYETILKSYDVIKMSAPGMTLETYLGDLVAIGLETLVEDVNNKMGIKFS